MTTQYVPGEVQQDPIIYMQPRIRQVDTTGLNPIELLEVERK